MFTAYLLKLEKKIQNKPSQTRDHITCVRALVLSIPVIWKLVSDFQLKVSGKYSKHFWKQLFIQYINSSYAKPIETQEGKLSLENKWLQT